MELKNIPKMKSLFKEKQSAELALESLEYWKSAQDKTILLKFGVKEMEDFDCGLSGTTPFRLDEDMNDFSEISQIIFSGVTNFYQNKLKKIEDEIIKLN